MDTRQAIVAGTNISADALSMSDQIGTLETDRFADIIGVPKDPEKDITTLQDVRSVMFGGEVVVDKFTIGGGVH